MHAHLIYSGLYSEIAYTNLTRTFCTSEMASHMHLAKLWSWMLKPKAGGNNSDTLGSTSSPGPTFADVEGSDPKRQRTCSSSLRAAKVVEINESLARVAS